VCVASSVLAQIMNIRCSKLPSFHLLLSLFLFLFIRFLRAEKAYKDGLYYNPNNPFLLQSWAVMLEKIGKTPEVMISVEDAMQ
jgi:hypothetical protein